MNSKKLIPIFSLVFLAVTFIGGWWLLGQQEAAYQTSKNKTTPKITFKLGPANECQRIPAFASSLGLKGQLAIDTEQRQVRGISFIEARSNGQRYQHPSWDDVGHVGSSVRDQQGNIYVLPIPVVSLEHNDPANRNTVYKIDTNTQLMAPYLALGLSTDQPRHPFGVLGASIDCDTNSLYISSVEGSLPHQEKGTTYQISLSTKAVVSRLENKDLFGLDILNTAEGKRLYYGSARSPHIYSVDLDQAGHFGSDHRYELSLAELPEGDTATPVKIRFSRAGTEIIMTVQKAIFDFRPSAANETGRNKYLYKLAKNGSWEFLERR